VVVLYQAEFVLRVRCLERLASTRRV